MLNQPFATQVPEENWVDYCEQNYSRLMSQLQGSGEEDDPYIVDSPDDLAALLITSILSIEYDTDAYSQPDRCWLQTADIDMSQYEWIAIPRFAGTYDGGGYTISGIISASTSYDVGYGSHTTAGLGLFGSLEEYATVQNVHLINSVFFSDASARQSYGIGALCAEAKIEAYLSDCSADAYISATTNSSRIDGLGGLVGNVYGRNECDICDCSFLGSIYVSGTTSAYIGGIVGKAEGGLPLGIYDCVFDGQVICNSGCSVGGLCGGLGNWTGAYELSMDVRRCLVKGILQTTGYVGGFGSIISEQPIYEVRFVDSTVNATLIGKVGQTLFTGSYNQADINCANCSFVGYFDSDNLISSFQGYGTFDPIYSPFEFGILTNCYAMFNGHKYAWFDDPESFAEGWRVVSNINRGLPIPKGLYSVANTAPQPTEDEVLQWFADFECIPYDDL